MPEKLPRQQGSFVTGSKNERPKRSAPALVGNSSITRIGEGLPVIRP
jgi:hypothetical protein